MFTDVLYLRNGGIESTAFGFHDDGAPTPFAPISTAFQSLFLLAFVGDFDFDAYVGNLWNVVLFDLFVFLVVIVMMNVLIGECLSSLLPPQTTPTGSRWLPMAPSDSQ